MENITLNITGNNIVLAGELTRQTVMTLPKESIKQIINQQTSTIDLQQVNQIDTAGLAWLFYLLELASQTGCQLTFSSVPAKLKKLISLSGVDGFLPVNPA
ncbi:STAS domain-containing protein [Colwellia sp. MSW7]|uniref:STAS domain-containing protein n=1 Tax=Colwellia maritima TaxID=2912588 RepID=A0ABS9X3Y0_9GAMM|nr:STAS domain-containing protein [Colwellia maritima]